MASDTVKELLIDVGLDIKLKDLGVKKDMIGTFVDDAFKYLLRCLMPVQKNQVKMK